ncbi:MAG: hypothetical protein H0X25_08120 [Acidobacteriales bacterium]|nr:hypothetical protein [Terriglobales bacterium]
MALGHQPLAVLNLDRRVSHFAVQHANLINALLMLGQQEHIPLAIEYIDKKAFESRISLDVRNASLQQVLTAITRPAGYYWMLSGSVVTVTHSGALTGVANLLNARIPRFTIPESTLQHASMVLAVNLYSVLNPHSGGIAGDYPRGNRQYLSGPFDLKDRTVREILNRIVSQHRNGAWVVQQPPWTMGEDLGYGFWTVIEYDRTDSTYSNRLQVRGLGLSSRNRP